MSIPVAHGLTGRLIITVHGGKDLKIVQLVGKQDPYCDVQCGKERFKTKVANDAGANCSWEQTFIFNLKAKDVNQEFVHFKVKDENTFKDTNIGRTDIKVIELVKHLNQARWIQIVDFEDYTQRCGLIQITVEFQGSGLEIEPAAMHQNNISQARVMPANVPIPLNSPPPVAQSSTILDPEVDRLAKLRHQIVEKHKISKFFANRLFKLEDYEIVLICDDSGSMSSKERDPNDQFAPPRTRWDELKQTVSIVTDIAGLMDESGIDIYFLNRPPIFGIKSTQQITAAFSDPPRGYTPIRDAITRVFQDKHDILYPQKKLSEMKGDIITVKDKKLLLIVCTDGQPTTSNGNDDQKTLHQFLVNRKPVERIYITFACCTDDDQAIGYLEEWDKNIPNFDVVDDYYTERSEVIKAQGVDFSFSPGDYVVKMLLGGIDPEVDKWDERRSAV